MKRTAACACAFSATTSLSQVLAKLEPTISDSAAARAGLLRYVELDRTAADSYTAATWKGKDSSSGTDILLRTLQCHQQDPEIAQMCARGLANVALLEQEDKSSIFKTDAPLREIRESKCVATLTSLATNKASQLSDKGLVWVSTALLNILLLEDEAARVSAGSIGGFSVFVDETVRRAEAASKSQDDMALMLAGMACDNMLAVIGRLLSMQLPGERTQEQGNFAYETVDYSLIEAALEGMRLFPATLEVQHKGWECLRLASLAPQNASLLFRAIEQSKGFKTAVQNLCDICEGKQISLSNPVVAEKTMFAGLETLQKLTDNIDKDDNTAVSALSFLGVGSVSASCVAVMVSQTKANFHGLSEDGKKMTPLCLALLANLAPWDAYVYSKSCIAVVLEMVKTLNAGAASTLGQETADSITMKMALYFWNITNHKEGVEACQDFKIDKMVKQFVARNPDVEIICKLDQKFDALVSNPQYVGDASKFKRD